MASGQRLFSVLLDIAGQVIRSLTSNKQQNPPASSRAGSRASGGQKPTARFKTERSSTASPAADDSAAGRFGDTATIEIDPPAAGALTISYAPQKDGSADAGEVVWTWVPYQENDGRGKDRPVLVIGRQSAERVYVVKLTSKAHDGQRDFLPIGAGAWDSQGRESWVDVDQVYSVHVNGLRREAAVLDKKRFQAVAAVLTKRYGWRAAF